MATKGSRSINLIDRITKTILCAHRVLDNQVAAAFDVGHVLNLERATVLFAERIEHLADVADREVFLWNEARRVVLQAFD